MKTTTSPIRYRALTTLLVVLGFAMLLVSGTVLLISPPGRVANWTQWAILGLTKRSWTDLHVVFGALFLVAGIIHLAFNWRPLLQHLGARMSGTRGFRPEWIVAAAIAVAVFAGTRAQVAPISTLLAWTERVKGSWEQGGEAAPIPHAELLSLAELARQAGVPTDEALRRLETAGVRGVGSETRVQAAADQAHVTPAKIYDLVRGRSTAGGATKAPGHGSGVAGASGGGGPGWKTLEQFCADEGLELAAVQRRLADKGLKATPGQTLREIAVGNGFDRPYALLEILRQK